MKDVYYAEKQSVRALGKSAKAAKLPELKDAIETHREESSHQVERLEQVFEILGKPARAKTCEAMKGIAAEMEEDLEDFGETAAADAVLIGCAQAVEHYEIARYVKERCLGCRLSSGRRSFRSMNANSSQPPPFAADTPRLAPAMASHFMAASKMFRQAALSLALR